MPEGIDNLSRLFGQQELPADPAIAVNHRYDFKLEHIREELDQRKPDSGMLSLSYRLAHFWPNVTLEQSAHEHRLGHGSFEDPYSSGHSNTAALFTEQPKNLGIWLTDGWLWSIAGVYGNDPDDAIRLYLDAIENEIKGRVVEVRNGLVVPKDRFAYGPDIGLSLVGSGDALIKAAQANPEKSMPYSASAERAYRSSGFGNTRYVQGRRESMRMSLNSTSQ